MLNEQHQQQIELLVDRHSVTEVIAALVEVCQAKADHINTNWQDTLSAAHWNHLAGKLDDCHDNIKKSDPNYNVKG
jgi:hypothetical protein|tara:strand:- start:1 stop:228 length:228 start_codon:yes stop_codon:yes gene_type:complete